MSLTLFGIELGRKKRNVRGRRASKQRSDSRRSGRSRQRPAAKTRNHRNARGWIGRDLANARFRGMRGLIVPIVVAGLLSLFALAALRVDVIRQRYAVQNAIELQRSLAAQRQVLSAERRQLRAPMRLEKHARELGFIQNPRVIDLDAALPSLAADGAAQASPSDKALHLAQAAPDEGARP